VVIPTPLPYFLFLFLEGDNIKILSFDQSTKITGYSLYDNSNLINYGTIQSDSKEEKSHRANEANV